MDPTPETLLTRPAAARFLTEQGYPTTCSTLATKATRGGGPEYECFGRRPLYRPAKLLEWARSRLSKPVRNSSEAAEARRLLSRLAAREAADARQGGGRNVAQA